MPYWTHTTLRLITVCLFILTFSGCGNKGDLYLPDTGSVDKNTPNESKTNTVKKKS